MISTEQLKNVIEAKLNELSSEMPFEFLIHANMGEFKAYQEQGQRELPKPLINGVLVSLPSSIIPLQSIKSYTATQLLTILAPQRPNDPQSGINDVLSVLQAFIESQAGFTGYLTDEDRTRYSYICAPQLPQVGQLGIEGVGFWHVPVSISLTWQFIAGGVISNSVKLKIAGKQVLLLEMGIVRTRIAETNNKSNSAEMQSLISQQGLTFKVIIPYTTDSVLCTVLMRDMLMGFLSNSYKVEYDDGNIKNREGENPSWQMVATEISANVAVGTVVSLSATFVIASDIYSV